MESGRVCSVPLKAGRSSITLVYGALVASTNLKCDAGETEDSLRDWVQLEDVNGRLPSYGMAHLCKDSSVFNGLVYNPLRWSIHHWRVYL